ncbi:alkaline phosphatase [Sandaracinobacter sp. RS1-74]|uniref:alkaline phosphatase n=1 Tax=Sandaracinobacteroides sayramensis TaxID=2913411 RepID=UPI001EDA245A|nr:alkaline phosphatase [Sandaracinobacteroides sayramensis]MCG2841770.1 alkaline phosphatase [Sandaracinobacteroides sayramensis]
MRILTLSVAALVAAPLAAPLAAQSISTTASREPSWKKAEAEVAARRSTPGAGQRAKNVIIFIGDGMGVSTITAARIYEAQKRAKAAGGSYPGFEGGEENLLSFEKLPNRALVKTYNTNAQVPDSAGTASAITTGTKTRIGVLGILPGQGADTCRTPAQFPKTLGELAHEKGMGLGIVTTTRITHATPAAMFAHSPSRDWEGADRAFPAEERKTGCADIASQLVGFRGGADVVLGGGLGRFRPRDAGGSRDDGRDLIAEWQKAWPQGRFVETAAPFRALDPKAAEPVFGLFHEDHLSFAFDADRAKEPSLAEMAVFAAKKLEARAKRSGKGYVLMVEGGRIDHAHHMTNAYRALDETAELSLAVEEVLKSVDLKETLVLVTADHSHVFTMSGYPPRANPILGLLRPIKGGEGGSATDANGNVLDQLGRPMTTLGYMNGPLEVRSGGKVLNSTREPTDPDFLQPKAFLVSSETHGGEDVALFGAGPGSALVSGTVEQNSIFYIMAHALGWK